MSDPVCRVCGCTEDQGCPPEGCSWVEPGLCSACHEVLGEVKSTADYDVLSKKAKTDMLRGAELAIRIYRDREDSSCFKLGQVRARGIARCTTR